MGDNMGMLVKRYLRASNAYRIVCKDPKGILVVKSYNSQMKKFIVGFTTEVTKTGTQVSFAKKTEAKAFLEKVKEDTLVLTRKYAVDTNKFELFHGRGTTEYTYRIILTQYGPCYIKAYAYKELLKKYYPRTIFDTDIKEFFPGYFDSFKVSERQLMIWAWDASLRQVQGYDNSVFNLETTYVDRSDPKKITDARKYFTPERLQNLINKEFITKIDSYLNLIGNFSEELSNAFKPVIIQFTNFLEQIAKNVPNEFKETVTISNNEFTLKNSKDVANYLTFLINNLVNVKSPDSSWDSIKAEILPKDTVDTTMEVLKKLWESAQDQETKLKEELKTIDRWDYRITTDYGKIQLNHDLITLVKYSLNIIYEFWKDVNMFFSTGRNLSGTEPNSLFILDMLFYFFYDAARTPKLLGQWLAKKCIEVNKFIADYNEARKKLDQEEITSSTKQITEQELNTLVLEGDDYDVDKYSWAYLPGLYPEVDFLKDKLLNDNSAGEKVGEWNKNTLFTCFCIRHAVQRKDGEGYLTHYKNEIKNFVNRKYKEFIDSRPDKKKINDKLPYSTLDNILINIPKSEGNFDFVGQATERRTAETPKDTYWRTSNRPEWQNKQDIRNPDYQSPHHHTLHFVPIMFDPSKQISFTELYDKWYDNEIGLIDIVDKYTLTLNQVYNSVVDMSEALSFFGSVYDAYKDRNVRNVVNKVNTDKWKKLNGE